MHRTFLLVPALVLLLAAFLKPGDYARDSQQSSSAALRDIDFGPLTAAVREAADGLPCALIDLDNLDANIDKVIARLGARQQLRLVVKSLPSLDLLHYAMARARTNRLMAFHAPHIPVILADARSRRTFAATTSARTGARAGAGAVGVSDGAELDFLMGKPVSARAAAAVIRVAPQAARVVQWLIDTPQRLAGYVALARTLGQPLRVSVEIDVGLRRGGAASEAELGDLLREVRAQSRYVEFVGLMGYDGHVPHAPPVLGGGMTKGDAVQRTFDSSVAAYARYVDVARAVEPEWFAVGSGKTGAPAESAGLGHGLTLNGGGSNTYALFAPSLDTPINDVALGSALLMPSSFLSGPGLGAHGRALFLAAPIVKRLDSPPLPFLEALWPWLREWNPNLRRGFFIYGQTWGGEILHPRGLIPGWFSDVLPKNLLPNQSLLFGSDSVQAEVDDYVYVLPREGDAMVAYNTILAVRGTRVEATWRPLPVLN